MRARVAVPTRGDEEEALAEARPAERRRTEGAYYTPRPLVDHLVECAAALVPAGPLRVVDPACGAGAFLAAAADRFPSAELTGVELSDDAATQSRARVPRARVVQGDALQGALEHVLPEDDTFELWLGNPPWNGTSVLLQRAPDYAALRARLAAGLRFPAGTSLRDDFAFFLLLARERLTRHPGALVFVTPASLLDAYFYAPLRRALLETLDLTEVLELGSGVFAGTRVRACATVWRSRSGRAESPRYRVRADGPGFSAASLGPPQRLAPAGPDWLLRPVSAEAAALDAAWREDGEPLTELVPLSFSGLKTRFDALLVDDDPDRLHARVAAFLDTSPLGDGMDALARTHALSPSLVPKLRALRTSVPEGYRASPDRIRPFFRYAGARHRGTVPESARAFCYLDRALIPRGDHRLRGDFDPHQEPVKLLFNVRELPLSAALVTEPGCVPAHRHARFAPLHVPARLLEEGIGAARSGAALGTPVPNLSPRGLAWAARLGSPHALFERLARFINSEAVQTVWAPVFGAHRTLPVNATCVGQRMDERPMSAARDS